MGLLRNCVTCAAGCTRQITLLASEEVLSCLVEVWDIRYTKVCENRAVLHKAHGLGRQMVRRTNSAMIPALATLLSPLIE